MSNLSSPLISVIIPIHNRPDDLLRSIPSVLAQTEQSFEILIIDDASTVDLKAIVDQFQDERIVYARNEKKGNAASVRNTGLDMARGKYIAFLDSDDEWFPEHLAAKISFMEASQADGVFGSTFVNDGSKDTYVQSRPIRPNQAAADYILGGGSIPPTTWIMKAACLKDLRFDPKLVVHEDYDFFIRFSKNNKWVAFWKPTSRMYWIRGVQRLRHPRSEMEFVKRYEKDISKRALFNYNFSQLGYYVKYGAEKDILEFYYRDCLKNPEVISFVDYSSVVQLFGKKYNFVIRWFLFCFLLLNGKRQTKA